MNITVIFGGPGTGKTSWLANKYKQLIKKYHPEQIAFISYTKKQVREGLVKVKELTNKKSKNLKDNFKTLHSMSRKSFTNETEVFDHVLYEKMSNYLGEDMTTVARGIDYMRNKMLKNDAIGANRAGLDTKSFQKKKLFYETVKNGYSIKGVEMIDYADMISHAAEDGYKNKVKYLLVDECQDFSPLQWQAIYKIFKNVREAYFAGDPNQALYRFAGGASDYMLEMRCDRTIILDQSHRYCKQIYDMAYLIWDKMEKKVEMPRYRKGRKGFAVFYPDSNLKDMFFEPIDWARKSGLKVMVLANTYYQLSNVEKKLLGNTDYPRHFIAGRKKEYYEGKEENPLIFSTVHQAKGQEADIVIYDVSCGQSGERSDYGTKQDRWEDYWKTVYTGITRAKTGLILFQLSRVTVNEPSCLDTLYYSKFGANNYQRFLNKDFPIV